MPVSRRYFQSGALYELVIRASEGIPFPCTEYMNLLIKSALARTQRDYKVEICDATWMGNHVHILAVFYDASKAIAFYGEVKKRLTESIKRLLGLNNLNLWEDRATVMLIADKEKAISRLVYIYSNPAKANLVHSIDDYPGWSTWKEFLGATNEVSYEHKEEVPWVRMPIIRKLESFGVTLAEDRAIAKRLRKKSKRMQTLVIKPNAWMKCFGIKDPKEVEGIRKLVIEELRVNEARIKEERFKAGTKIIGAKNLRTEPIMKPHKPKRKERKIFFLASTKELRLQILESFRAICEKCRECYEKWKHGDYRVTWPPGVFLPPLPHRASAIAGIWIMTA